MTSSKKSSAKLFQEHLKRIKEETGLSEAKLSEKCNLSRTYYGMLMRGDRDPSFEILDRICEGFELKPSELFTEDFEQNF
ncbi:MAG: helix-turn-helix domain-containing protein [bacterium]